ncbi:hypothetical protein JXA47_06605, partial [Candidatus Sumerlaeota bacterium]|nr:hypothetical protein [Candidatus Sumerlaeota bacterium]
MACQQMNHDIRKYTEKNIVAWRYIQEVMYLYFSKIHDISPDEVLGFIEREFSATGSNLPDYP